MDEVAVRVLRVGLPQKRDPRRMAVFLVVLMFASIATPVEADLSVTRDDFGVLDALEETLNSRTDSGESELATQEALLALNAVDLNARPLNENDALVKQVPIWTMFHCATVPRSKSITLVRMNFSSTHQPSQMAGLTICLRLSFQ